MFYDFDDILEIVKEKSAIHLQVSSFPHPKIVQAYTDKAIRDITLATWQAIMELENEST